MPYKNRPPCSMTHCDKLVNARGLCSMHYYRLRNNGDPNVVQPRRRADCSVPACTAKAWSKSLCSKHLARLQRHGSTDDPRQTVDERFWSKVNKNGPDAPQSWDGAPLDGQCWTWGGSHNETGHGLFFPARREPEGAHRYAYRTLVGSIPDGLFLDHLCRRPSCVNPAHLEPVTPAENTRRGSVARKEIA